MTKSGDNKIIYIYQNEDTPMPTKEGIDMPKALFWVKVFFGIYGRLLPRHTARIAYRFFTTPRVRAKHKRTDSVLERARLFEVVFGSYLLKCYEWGDRKNPTILLVHGWESRGTALRSFVIALVASGYHVVALDAPAHGNTSGRRTSLFKTATAIRAVWNHLGEVYGIIGHSFGGSASIFLLSYIEKERTLEKFVIIGVPSSLSNVVNRFRKMVGIPNIVYRHFIKLAKRKNKIEGNDINYAEACQRTKIKEALVIHDKEDPVVPFEEGKEIAEAWGCAKMIVTQGLGHFRIVKNPKIIAEVVDFMSDEPLIY